MLSEIFNAKQVSSEKYILLLASYFTLATHKIYLQKHPIYLNTTFILRGQINIYVM